MNSSTPASPRLARINQALLSELSQLLLTEVADKSLRWTQLTKVVASKDLSTAKVYFLVADPKLSHEKILKKLKRASNWFRFELARRMELRVTPELKFFYDDQLEKAQELTDLLNKL